MKKPIIAAVIGMLLIAAAAFAQYPPPCDGSGPPPFERRAEMDKRIHAMKIWKLTEILDLDAKQEDKFFPMFRKFEDSVQDIVDENDELFEKLDGYVKLGENNSEINNLIAQIEKNGQRIMDAKTQFMKDAGKILNDVQLAKLVLFQHQFPRKFRETMMKRHGDRMDRGAGMNRDDRREFRKMKSDKQGG